MRYKSLENRRRSSVARIIGELEEFKIEIQERFSRSKFNHNYVFPRKKSKDRKPTDYVASK